MSEYGLAYIVMIAIMLGLTLALLLSFL